MSQQGSGGTASSKLEPHAGGTGERSESRAIGMGCKLVHI